MEMIAPAVAAATPASAMPPAALPPAPADARSGPALGFDRIEGGAANTSATAYALAGHGDFEGAYRAQGSLAAASAPAAQPDPWGVAGAAVGSVIGAIIGGGAGGIGGGAGGTLVAPGIGTVGGGIAGGAEGAVVGGAVGAGAGYGIGSALHGIISWMTGSSSSGTSDPQKADPAAAKPFRDDPGQLAGKSPADVEKELDQKLVDEGHWTKSASRDGNGVRYTDGKGDSVIINKGYPDGIPGGDAVHQGPYVKIQPGNIRVPLAGNPAAGS